MKWNTFVHGDCFDVMTDIEDRSVDLIFTSPPDISQTNFENDIGLYKSFQRRACSSYSRLVKDDGFILIAQTDRKINGEILPNHITYYNAMIDYGWKLKDYKIE